MRGESSALPKGRHSFIFAVEFADCSRRFERIIWIKVFRLFQKFLLCWKKSRWLVSICLVKKVEQIKNLHDWQFFFNYLLTVFLEFKGSFIIDFHVVIQRGHW